MSEVIKQSRAELQEEFQRAKIWRDTQRELKNIGRILSLDEIKEVVDIYQRLTSGESLPWKNEEPQEILVDRDMVRSKISDDDDAA